MGSRVPDVNLPAFFSRTRQQSPVASGESHFISPDPVRTGRLRSGRRGCGRWKRAGSAQSDSRKRNQTAFRSTGRPAGLATPRAPTRPGDRGTGRHAGAARRGWPVPGPALARDDVPGIGIEVRPDGRQQHLEEGGAFQLVIKLRVFPVAHWRGVAGSSPRFEHGIMVGGVEQPAPSAVPGFAPTAGPQQWTRPCFGRHGRRSKGHQIR